ncbi:MAG: GntR family transcriptional regulator [Finegoldia magna]|nr:GntR family transcriptional regulator [Finegoldia magna]
MQFDDNKPIYIQIVDYFKYKIIRQELKSSDKIPSVRETAKELNVNPNTVQRAYAELESYGVTMSKRGLGSFVDVDDDKLKALKNDMAQQLIDDFLNEMYQMNMPKEKLIKLIDERWKK